MTGVQLDTDLRPARQLAARLRSAGFVASPIALALAALSLVPVVFVVHAFVTTGVSESWDLIWRPLVFELLRNTIVLAAVAVPICAALGVLVAWLVERTDLPGRRIWGPLFVAPLAIPAFVNSYAWVGLIPSIHGLWPAVLVVSLSYFPFVYLPTAAALRRLDQRLEESAGSLGSTPFQVFRRIVLPQLRLPILGGSLLVSLHVLAEFGAFAMLRYNTFTVAIFSQFQSAFVSAAGTMLAGVLLLLSVGLLVGEGFGRGSARYSAVGGGAIGRRTPMRLGSWRGASVATLSLLALLALGVPLWMLGRWLWLGGLAVWEDPAVAAAVASTVQYASTGALLTTAMAFPVAWLVSRFRNLLARSLEGINYVSSALPGIVVALAFVTVAVNWFPAIYESAAVLLLAYVVLFVPRALVSIRTGLAQIPDSLTDASASLGKAPIQTFTRVILRLSAPSVAAGAALVFVAICNELTATLLLSPRGTSTLSTEFWAYSSDLDYAAAAPYALLMVVVAIPVTYWMFAQSRKVAGV